MRLLGRDDKRQIADNWRFLAVIKCRELFHANGLASPHSAGPNESKVPQCKHPLMGALLPVEEVGNVDTRRALESSALAKNLTSA